MRYAVQMLLMDNKNITRWRNYVAIAARHTLSLFLRRLRPDTVELSRQTATKSDVVKAKRKRIRRA